MPLRPTARFPEEAIRRHARGEWGRESLGEGFARTCTARGDAVALIDGDRRVTFAEWDRCAAAAARGLADLGVGPGDVVAYQLPNWWEAAVLFLATARLGAVVNPVLPIFRERELAFILRQSGATVLAIPGTFRGCDYPALVGAVRDQAPSLRAVLVARATPPSGTIALSQLLATAPPPPAVPVDADALLMLMYTSGTTAEPKGVLHSHNTLLAEVRSLERVHALTPADRTLMPSPLTHISGVIHAILTPALLGTSAVLMERWDADAGLALLSAERVTYMVGAPTFLQDLTERVERGGARPPALRLFSCGGAAVSAELIRRSRARLGCVAKRVYGSTEFPTITTTGAADAATMGAETEGRVIAPAELRIVDAIGGALPAGAEGEVQARGPECCLGYADPTLTAEAFTADGWFRTGDLGSVDAAGYLRITGRLKEIVIRKGEKFSLREIEEAIARHPAVAEAAVVALPDARSGERACAVVVPRAGATLTLDDLSAFLLGAGLARQKLPEQLELVEALPRTDSGKLHRAALRHRFA
ncbi:MAG: AMP-binding protein [Candidatus Binatia bacterium]